MKISREINLKKYKISECDRCLKRCYYSLFREGPVEEVGTRPASKGQYRDIPGKEHSMK